VLNEILLKFAQWIAAMPSSSGLHESFYMYNWIESTHVLTLTVFLGMLLVIDLRMLGLIMPTVPASTIAHRLDRPMMIGFTVMIVTGLALFWAIPIRSTQSIWFRLKVVLLIAAGINAFLFRKHMSQPNLPWDKDPVPPKRVRIGAALSLTFWAGVVIAGRCIAYDWFDCNRNQGPFISWAAGCNAGDIADAE
jgi:hypothetical protein